MGPKEDEVCGTPISEYERSRDERVRENLEEMKKLGIFELSVCLKPHHLQPRRFNKTPHSSISPSYSFSEPTRRSSRLKNTPAVTYSELKISKKNMKDNDEDILVEIGSRAEIYSEKHEKLLGGTDKIWTLFVDGYGANGKRIYDPLRGKTCHQCRQKTLGLRTRCSECDMVQGQFCGDCLYMRYGEHVDEANENPNWVCPVCRGICNCSLCRNAKGWAPTGPLYKKITRLGFKSVAHYLIETRRSEPKALVINESCVKRSLAFSEDHHHQQHSSEPPVLSFKGIASREIETKVDSPNGNATKKKKNVEPSSESIGARLRKRRGSVDEEGGGIYVDTPPKTTAPRKRLLGSPAKPSPELALAIIPSRSASIGGRLRLRHKVMAGVESD